MSSITGTVLVVDDHNTNRLKISMAVKKLGHEVEVAVDGEDALQKLTAGQFDLVLLDILMPRMDGYQVLSAMKQDDRFNGIPVIVISAVDEFDSVIRAIELGAEDYLPKSFDPVLLKARVNACLEKKQLRDKTRQQLAITEELFGKFVPKRIAESILEGHGHIAPVSQTATIMFTDIKGFTTLSEKMEPAKIAAMLNEYFSAMIEPINQHGGVLNQFLGDAMMVVYNIPVQQAAHADKAIRTAQDILDITSKRTFAGVELTTRIGICTGEVFAGNIGSGDRLHYTVYGDTVNSAARLEQLNKQTNTQLLLAETTIAAATEQYRVLAMGELPIRGRSPMSVYSVV